MGTIKSVGPGGAGGSIVASEVSGVIVETTPGEIIFFTEPAPPDLRVGDLVTFDIVIDPSSPPHGELATSVTRLSAGTVITQDHDGTIQVGPDESVVITGGRRSTARSR
jgi:hypothetical protein